MADIDLRTLPDNEFVLHFGGRPSEVNAFTFSNSLIGLSEAIQEINRQINPDFSIEITIDGVGTGSFRAKLKTASKSIAGLFKHRYTEQILIGLLTTFIWQKICPDDQIKIVVTDDSYIVERGADRIVLPKEFEEARKKITNKAAITKHVARTFEALQEDPSVTDFGFARHINDQTPFALIPQSDFVKLAEEDGGDELDEQDDTRHTHDERTKVTVLKAIFERGGRRWQFVWHGIRISAPIKSDAFYDRIARREYEFGQGEILDVTLRITRVREEMTGVFINEKYEIVEVHGLEKSPKQQWLLP
jgi:hypothetical protein